MALKLAAVGVTIALTVLLLFSSISPVLSSPVELLANPGFEDGLKGWKTFGLFDAVSSTTFLSHSGQRSVLVSVLPPYQDSTTRQYNAGFNQTVAQNFLVFDLTFSFWVRPQASSLMVLIRNSLVFNVRDSGGTVRNYTLHYYTGWPEGNPPTDISGPTSATVLLMNIYSGAPGWNEWNQFTRNIRQDFRSKFGSTDGLSPVSITITGEVITITTVSGPQDIFWDDLSLTIDSTIIPEIPRILHSATVLAIGMLVLAQITRNERRNRIRYFYPVSSIAESVTFATMRTVGD